MDGHSQDLAMGRRAGHRPGTAAATPHPPLALSDSVSELPSLSVCARAQPRPGPPVAVALEWQAISRGPRDRPSSGRRLKSTPRAPLRLRILRTPELLEPAPSSAALISSFLLYPYPSHSPLLPPPHTILICYSHRALRRPSPLQTPDCPPWQLLSSRSPSTMSSRRRMWTPPRPPTRCTTSVLTRASCR